MATAEPAALTTASVRAAAATPAPRPEPAPEAAPDPAPAAAPESAPEASGQEVAPKPGSFAELQARGKALGLKVVGVTKADLEAAIADADGSAPQPVPASVKEAIKVTQAASKAGHPVEVVESFTTLVRGSEVHYRKGELVHPEDPVLSRSPELFRPTVYPHGRHGLGNPEVRS